MDWTGTGTTNSAGDADGSGSAKKTDETRAVKRARRREQQKAAQQRYRCVGAALPQYLLWHGHTLP
jgi:hypothetical protein